MRLGRNSGRRVRAIVLILVALGAAFALSSATRATAPPFTVQLDDNSYTSYPGGTVDVSVSLQLNDNSFGDPVNICVYVDVGGSPAGKNANLSGEVDFAGGSYSQQTMTVLVSDNLFAPNQIALWAAPCDASNMASAAPFTLHLTTPPNYTIDTFETAHGVVGQSVALDVNIQPTNGFNSTVSMCLFGGNDGSDAPTGITLENEPVSFDVDNYDQQLTVDIASDVAPDTYAIFFGDCSATHFSNELDLTVEHPTFHYGFFGDDLTKHSGESFTNSIATSFDSGFSGPATFTAAPDNPAGIVVGSIPSAASSGATSQFTVDVASSVATGDYLVGIVGHGSGVPDDEEQFSLHVDHPAPDGHGTMSLDETNAGINTPGNTLHFHYVTGDQGGTFHGAVQITLPDGWSPPSTDASNAGYVTSSSGSVGVSDQTITISSLDLGNEATVDITYGDESGGGPGATAPGSGTPSMFTAQEKSTDLGDYGSLNSTSVDLTAGPGTGTLTVSPKTVAVGATGLTETFTYTAADGGVTDGELLINVPDGWSPASTNPDDNGFTFASSGGGSDVAVGAPDDGALIDVTGITLAAGDSMTISYGDKTQGASDGASGPPGGGSSEWSASEASSPAQDTADLAASPTVVAASPDGSGSLDVDPAHAGLGTTGNTLDFTYANAALGDGEVDITVPTGWSAPSLNGADPGYVSASCQPDCTVGLGTGDSSRTIKVTGINMGTDDQLGISYGDKSGSGPGASAPVTGTSSTFAVQEQSTSAGGSLTTLTDADNVHNVVGLVAPDGSGTMTVAPPVVVAGSSGFTETFTYKAATGGLDKGSVALVVPDDWDAPQTESSDGNGYVTTTGCDGCEISIDSQTITVSDVTLAGASSFAIVYANGEAPPTGGDETWFTYEQSSTDGSSTEFADGTEPDVSAVAGDGTGDITVDPQAAVTGVSHNTLDFQYTADDGGLTGGTITIHVPAGWSPPSIKKTDPGFTTCNVDGCKVAVDAKSMLITVSSLTFDGGETADIVYGDQSQGSSGAKSGAAGSAVFLTQEKSWAGGMLTTIGATVDNPAGISPVVTVLGPPTITTFTDVPLGGHLGLWDDAVEIDGTNFQSVTDVQFNGLSVATFDPVDNGDGTTTINTEVPEGATSGKITLVYPGGKVVSTAVFTVIVKPEIDSFSPSGGIPTADLGTPAGTKVVIKGSGFTGANDPDNGGVSFGDTPATTFHVDSDTQITATVPNGATTGEIQVTNAADTTPSDQDFIVLQAPSISDFFPTSGGPGMTIDIDGAGFDYGGIDPKLRPVVKFNGKVSTSVHVVSDILIEATVPTGATSGKITVTNLAASAPSDDGFTVVNPPKVTGFLPALGIAATDSTDGTTVVISGSNFAGSTDVLFAGADDPIDVGIDDSNISSHGTKVTVEVPANAVTGQIAVVNGGGTVYSKASFSVVVTPSDMTLSPSSGKVGGIVTIYGQGFTGTTAVLFPSDAGGGATVTSKFSFKGDGQLNVTVPLHAVTGSLTIVNPAAPTGVDTDDAFNVVAAPSVASFTPITPAAIGDAVTITGSNFTFATKVAFAGVPQTDIAINIDGTQITTTVPPGAKSGKVSVTAPAGTGMSLTSFSVIPPPVIGTVTPLQGGVGAAMTITGSNFVHVNEVDVGDGSQTYTVVSPTKITLTLNSQATSGHVVVSTTDHGYAWSSKLFTRLHAPAIDSLSTDPPQGVIGAVVHITGSGFTGASSVTFGGVPAKFTVADDGTINTSVPKAAKSGVIEVKVTGFAPADSVTFSVIVAPKFTGFVSSLGKQCDTLVIKGSGLAGVYQITWHGDTLLAENDDFGVISDNEIDVLIPGDASSGKLTLTNAAGSVTTTPFTITGADC